MVAIKSWGCNQMSEWYFENKGQQNGPISKADLQAKISAGELGADALIWKDGMADWLPVAQVSEFSVAGSGGQSHYAPPTSNPVNMNTGNSLPAVPPTSGLAIACLVCGILAIVACYIHALFGIPAVICGHMSMKQFRDPNRPMSGKGMAIAGLICGYIGILIQVVILVFIGFFAAAVANGEGGFKDLIEEAERIERQQQEMQDQFEETTEPSQ